MKASRIGEVLVFSLRVLEIRRKSFRLAIEASHEAEPRVRAVLVLASVSLGETLRSTEVPDSLRTAMERYLG